MDSTNLDSLDQSSLQNILGGSAPSLIPESLVTTLTVGFIVLNVLGVLFFVFYVINLIRKWRVDSAILHIQKDVAEIKASLSASSASSAPAPPPPSEPVAQPAEQNRVIAQSDATDDSSSTA